MNLSRLPGLRSALLACVLAVALWLVPTTAAHAQNPASITTAPLEWIKAGDIGGSDNSAVASWSAAAGLAITQSVTGQRPTLHTSGGPNSQPYVNFSGLQALYTSGLSSSAGSYSVFAVQRMLVSGDNGNWTVDSATGRLVFYANVGASPATGGFYDGAFQSVANTSALASQWVIYEWEMSAGSSTGTLYVNGTSVGSAAYVPTPIGGATSFGNAEDTATGGSTTSAAAGDLSEVAVWNTLLVLSDRNAVGSYLAGKYGISTAYLAPATSYTQSLSASSGSVGAGVVITYTPNGGSSATITPAVSGVSGSFSPSTVSFDGSNAAKTVTFTPSTAGTASLTATNSGSLTNPGSQTYTVSAGSATAYTMTGPSTGVSGVASTSFTITVNGVYSGTITPAVSGISGTFTPTSLTYSSSGAVKTFTFTPSSVGTATISATSSPGLTNPSNITYTSTAAPATSYTLTGPSTGSSGVASTSFTVSVNGPYSGTITPAASGISGTFSPTSLTYSNSSASQTFTFTPASAGTATISTTSSPSLTNPSSVSYVSTSTAVQVAPNNSAILYSPYNWLVTSGAAKTINAGAYFRTQIVSSTTCTIGLSIGTATPYSECWARLDGGVWQEYIPTSSGAQTWSLTMPTGTTATKHLLEFVVKSTTETQDRWNAQTTAISFTGVTLDSGASVVLPSARPFRVIIFGDSITEGVRVYGYTGIANDTDRNDNLVDYSFALGQLLDAEIGVVGFGGSGLTVTGSGNVPVLPASYALLWSGQSRTFSPVPDLTIYNEGTNDGTASLGSTLATVINGIGYTGSSNTFAGLSGTRHLVLRPFGGFEASSLQSIVSGIGNANVVYGDTSGLWSTADSSDGTHPYAYAHLGQIAPGVAALAQPLLHPSSLALSAPTVTAQPVSQSIPSGSTATFAVAFAANPSPSIQWRVSTNSGSTWTAISGATSGTYTTGALTTTSSGYEYDAVATNTQGSVTSAAATVTVTSAGAGGMQATDPIDSAYPSGVSAVQQFEEQYVLDLCNYAAGAINPSTHTQAVTYYAKNGTTVLATGTISYDVTNTVKSVRPRLSFNWSNFATTSGALLASTVIDNTGSSPVTVASIQRGEDAIHTGASTRTVVGLVDTAAYYGQGGTGAGAVVTSVVTTANDGSSARVITAN